LAYGLSRLRVKATNGVGLNIESLSQDARVTI